MAEILFRDIDPEEFRRRLTEDVVSRLTPLINTPQQPLLVDRIEMAKLLSISPNKLGDLVSQNAIPSVKVGTRRLFSPDAVANAITTNKKEV